MSKATHFVIAAAGKVTHVGFTSDGTLPPGAVPITDTEAAEAGSWSTIVNGALVVGTKPLAPLAMMAQPALTASDIIVSRCLERGIQVPADWQNYREQLREIVRGKSTSTTLPVLPAKPAGI